MNFRNVISNSGTRVINAHNRGAVGGGKIYRTVNTISIAGLFLAVGLIVFAAMGFFTMSLSLGCFIAIVAFVCASCVIALPWVRLLERGEFKKTSIVFLCLDALCCLLWVICAILVTSLIRKVSNETVTDTYLVNTLQLIKISLVITFQFTIASWIGTGITRYRSTMVAFQVIAYISYLVLDVFVSMWMFAVGFQNADPYVFVNYDLVALINTKPAWTFLVLSFLYSCIANGIMKRHVVRRSINMADDAFRDSVKDEVEYKKAQREGRVIEDVSETNQENYEQKLEKLKNMFEKDLITKEEYEQKKKDILKDM